MPKDWKINSMNLLKVLTQKFKSLKQEAEVAAQNGQAAVEDAKDAVKKAVK